MFVASSIEGLPATECWQSEDIKVINESVIKEYIEEAVDTEFSSK